MRERLISILQANSWRFREVRQLTQGYTASQGETKVWVPVGLPQTLDPQESWEQEVGGWGACREDHCTPNSPVPETPPTGLSRGGQRPWPAHFCISACPGPGFRAERACWPTCVHDRNVCCALSCAEQWLLHRGGGAHLPALPQRPASVDPRGRLPQGLLLRLRHGQQQGGVRHCRLDPAPGRPGSPLPLGPPPCRGSSLCFSGFSLPFLDSGLFLTINSSSSCWSACCFF